MNKVLSILAILVTAAVTVWAVQTTLQSFTARSESGAVKVEWRSTAEVSLDHYELERAGDDQVFRTVAVVDAKGSNQSYSYLDEEAFGKRDGSDGSIAKTYFTYRLKMVSDDRSATYSNTTGVSHSVSGIKRTWGMIKEMFR
jgi:hypothetical protein